MLGCSDPFRSLPGLDVHLSLGGSSHPVMVTTKDTDKGKFARVFLYSYYTTIRGLGGPSWDRTLGGIGAAGG